MASRIASTAFVSSAGLVDAPHDCHRRADRLRGLVEGGEESVAGGVFLVPLLALDLGPDDGPEVVKERLPAPIPELSSDLRRADDVQEQDGCEAARTPGWPHRSQYAAARG
jgi:hypothetical protein